MKFGKFIYPFLFLFIASLTLVACDTNEAPDTEVEAELVTQTTTTAVSVNTAVVQEQITQVQTTFAGVVGADVTVDPTQGAIVQVSSTATSSTGSQTTTTATIAPLVNATSGQPTGQAVVTIQSGGTTSTVVSSVNTSNPANLVSTMHNSSGAATQFPLDSNFNPEPVTTQSTSPNVQFTVAQMNEVYDAIPNYSTSVEAEAGKTYAQLITEALAAGKSGEAEVNEVLTRLGLSTFTIVNNSVQTAIQQCSANSSATEVVHITIIVGSTQMTLTYTCGQIRTPTL